MFRLLIACLAAGALNPSSMVVKADHAGVTHHAIPVVSGVVSDRRDVATTSKTSVVRALSYS